MGPQSFTKYLAKHIETLLLTIECLDKQIRYLNQRNTNPGIETAGAHTEALKKVRQLIVTCKKIEALKTFCSIIKVQWSQQKNCIIGHIV